MQSTQGLGFPRKWLWIFQRLSGGGLQFDSIPFKRWRNGIIDASDFHFLVFGSGIPLQGQSPHIPRSNQDANRIGGVYRRGTGRHKGYTQGEIKRFLDFVDEFRDAGTVDFFGGCPDVEVHQIAANAPGNGAQGIFPFVDGDFKVIGFLEFQIVSLHDASDIENRRIPRGFARRLLIGFFHGGYPIHF